MNRLLASVLTCSMALGCALPQSQHSSRPLLPLAVDYTPPRSVSGPVRLRVGEPFLVGPYLVNVGSEPMRVLHGPRLFILEARRFGSSDPTEWDRLSFPPADSWGEVRRMEHPSPDAVGPTPQIAVLEPGEQYAPARVRGSGDYTVRFEEPGSYNVRVCADLANDMGRGYGPQHLRICAGRDIGIVVQ